MSRAYTAELAYWTSEAATWSPQIRLCFVRDKRHTPDLPACTQLFALDLLACTLLHRRAGRRTEFGCHSQIPTAAAPAEAESPKLSEMGSIQADEAKAPKTPPSTNEKKPTQEDIKKEIEKNVKAPPPQGGKGHEGCKCKPSLLERLICALKELDLDPHANPNVFVKLEHEGVEWEWTKKHLKPPGGKTVVKIGIEPPNLPHADSRVTMKNLQDDVSIY